MDSRDYKTFRILEEISHNNGISQRTLAEKLNVSLGLVNSFVKHLAAKGYFRARALPRERVRYILTPEGAAEKTRLAYDYIRHSFDLYKKSYNVIHGTVDSLTESGVRTVAFYGVGGISDLMHQVISRTSLELVAVVDDFHKGKVFHGRTAIGLDEVHSVQFDRMIVTMFDNQQYSSEIIIKAGVDRDKIVILDHQKYV